MIEFLALRFASRRFDYQELLGRNDVRDANRANSLIFFFFQLTMGSNYVVVVVVVRLDLLHGVWCSVKNGSQEQTSFVISSNTAHGTITIEDCAVSGSVTS